MNTNKTMNTTKLMEMYKSTFQPALAEGVYEVKMLSHKYVTHTKGDYIAVTFEVLETGRTLTENRFEKGFPVMVSHLRQQLGRENEAIQPIEFFDDLIAKQTPFKIWIVKRRINGAPKTNFHFLEPIKEETVNTTVVEDDAVEGSVVEDDTIVPNTDIVEE